MYNPSGEQADKDREAAFEKGVPHGMQLTLLLIVFSDVFRICGGWRQVQRSSTDKAHRL